MIGNHIALVGCAFSRLVCAETAHFVMPDNQPFTPKSSTRKSGAAAIKRAANKRKAAKRGRR